MSLAKLPLVQLASRAGLGRASFASAWLAPALCSTVSASADRASFTVVPTSLSWVASRPVPQCCTALHALQGLDVRGAAHATRVSGHSVVSGRAVRLHHCTASCNLRMGEMPLNMVDPCSMQWLALMGRLRFRVVCQPYWSIQ